MSVTIEQMIGGGESWLYALQDGKVLGAAHRDDNEAMQRLYDIQKANDSAQPTPTPGGRGRKQMSRVPFKVGDIVSWSGGRICNGMYGVIAIGPYGELCVLDNEGAPDMDVAGHEAELRVVGNEKDNADLLDIFASSYEPSHIEADSCEDGDAGQKESVERIRQNCELECTEQTRKTRAACQYCEAHTGRNEMS